MVRSQLDRCGPEHHHGPPAVPAGWSSSLLLAVGVLAWVAGVLLLETGLCGDQLNLGELEFFELVSRRLQLWEEVYSQKLL